MINVNPLLMSESMPKSRFFIPAPAMNASKIPINDSPAIKPDDKRIPQQVYCLVLLLFYSR